MNNTVKFQSETINEKIRYWELHNVEPETLKYLVWVDEDGYADDIEDKLGEIGYEATVDWLNYEWISDPAIAERLVAFFTS